MHLAEIARRRGLLEASAKAARGAMELLANGARRSLPAHGANWGGWVGAAKRADGERAGGRDRRMQTERAAKTAGKQSRGTAPCVAPAKAARGAVELLVKENLYMCA